MENDRTVRRLTLLDQSASTARVLNLLATHRRMGDDEEFLAAPFFENRLLDRSIILKHRLRPHEYGFFAQPRATVTKLLLPIDTTDLKVGARSAFIGQKDFHQVVESVLGDALRQGSRDRMVLEQIDALPSLDPFLLREQLRTNGIEPSMAYFGISEADVQRMFEFVRKEVLSLVSLTADGPGAQTYAAKLVDKLLSSSPADGFEPLKQTLKLSDKEYTAGIFSWRGFLYYKWVLGDLGGPVQEVISEVSQIQSRGPRNPDATKYIAEARPRIDAAIRGAVASVEGMLDVYNKAYSSLTVDAKPTGFRDFLLSAPGMFATLGEHLGAVQHIVSFWRYRFPRGKARVIGHEELQDVFLDFEDSMTFAEPQTHAAGQAAKVA